MSSSVIDVLPASSFYSSVVGSAEAIADDPIIGRAFSHGGFIAGGFLNHCLRTGHWDHAYDGDIDVFFSERPSCDSFIDGLPAIGIVPRVRLFIYDIMHGNKKYQVIANRFLGPSETLLGFDLENVRVGLSNEHLYVSSRRQFYESRNEVHLSISGFNMRDKLIYRIPKYLSKGYDRLSLETRRSISDWIDFMSDDAQCRLHDRVSKLLMTQDQRMIDIVVECYEEFHR